MPKTSFEEECERLVLETKGVRSNPEDNQLENLAEIEKEMLESGEISLSVSLVEDNQWEIRIADKINRYRDGYGQLTHIIADIQTLLSQQAEKQRKEWGESLLEIEKRLKDLTNNNE